MDYCLRKAKLGEEKIVFNLIKDRISWMNKNNIHQWNEDDYLDIYPLQYYTNNINNIYVLETNNKIVSAAILLKEDKRWNTKEPSIYIHNFVSSLKYKGSGTIFIEKLTELAKKENISYLRLDSSIDNNKLENYYSKLGFKECGICTDGNYQGVLREKKI